MTYGGNAAIIHPLADGYTYMALVNSILVSVKRHFISGVLVVVPLILTYIVLRFLFEAVDGLLQPVVHRVLGYYVSGLGIVSTLLLIILTGIFTRNIVGRRLYRIGDRFLVSTPIIRPIYSAAKQLLEALTGPSERSFKQVALVEYPRRGVFALCFIANEVDLNLVGRSGEYVTVFVPSTPTPISGVVIMAPADQVRPVNMTVEEGIKFLVSGGVASPEIINEKTAVHGKDNCEVLK